MTPVVPRSSCHSALGAGDRMVLFSPAMGLLPPHMFFSGERNGSYVVKEHMAVTLDLVMVISLFLFLSLPHPFLPSFLIKGIYVYEF